MVSIWNFIFQYDLHDFHSVCIYIYMLHVQFLFLCCFLFLSLAQCYCFPCFFFFMRALENNRYRCVVFSPLSTSFCTTKRTTQKNCSIVILFQSNKKTKKHSIEHQMLVYLFACSMDLFKLVLYYHEMKTV